MSEANEPRIPLPEITIRPDARLVPMYRVLLHNDDVNDMGHVVYALQQVFRFDVQTAAAVMVEAHLTGVAHCATEPLEHAELHRDQLAAFSLTATIEPE